MILNYGSVDELIGTNSDKPFYLDNEDRYAWLLFWLYLDISQFQEYKLKYVPRS